VSQSVSVSAPPITTSLPPAPQPTYHTEVDAAKLWIGGLVTAVIAGFTGVVMLHLATGVFNTALFVPEEAGSDVLVLLSEGRVIAVAALATLVATAVLWLMLIAVPNGGMFWGVLGTVVLALSMLWPLSIEGLDEKHQLWLLLMNFIVGLVILGLLTALIPVVSRVVRTDP
jgi:hypothetical protein